MAVQQTECYRVVTIGYLKSFIEQSGSSSLIKDSGNESVSKIITRTDNTYCPTYGELIGGSIIQTWSQGSTPNGDRDGIYVKPSAILGGNYAANQLVDQHDLELRYTRFNTFTVSSESGDISQCGGSKTVSYTHKYDRYNKTMNASCSVSTTSETVSDTENSEVSWSPGSYGSITFPTYSIGRQPEQRTADRRCTTVTGSITFRGTSHSDTTQICQAALGGGWDNYEGRHYTSVTVYPSTTSTFGCDGGSFSVTSTGYFYDRYEWKDDCGTVYHSSPYDDRSGSETGPSSSGSFGALECDCEGTRTDSKTLTINYHGYSNSATFNQSCAACPDDPKCSGDTRYRWVNDGDEYICDVDSHDKYHQEKKQVSTDSGATWTDVDPKETRKGSLWESCSTDCGCPPTPTHCEITGPTEFYSCGGGTKDYDIETS